MVSPQYVTVNLLFGRNSPSWERLTCQAVLSAPPPKGLDYHYWALQSCFCLIVLLCIQDVLRVHSVHSRLTTESCDSLNIQMALLWWCMWWSGVAVHGPHGDRNWTGVEGSAFFRTEPRLKRWCWTSGSPNTTDSNGFIEAEPQLEQSYSNLRLVWMRTWRRSKAPVPPEESGPFRLQKHSSRFVRQWWQTPFLCVTGRLWGFKLSYVCC